MEESGLGWEHVKDLLVLGIGTSFTLYCRTLVQSVQELSIRVAVIIEKLEHHEDRIRKLEDSV